MSGKPSSLWRFWEIDAVAVAAGLALAAAVYVLGIQGVLQQHQMQVQQRTQLEVRRQRAQQLVSSLAGLQQQLEETRAAQQASHLQLQPAYAINQRLAEITGLANECGLGLQQVAPDAVRREPRYEAVPIRLSGSGSYPTCARFLHRLHAVFPDMGVAAFELTGNPSVPGAPASFRFHLIWHAAPTTATALIAP